MNRPIFIRAAISICIVWTTTQLVTAQTEPDPYILSEINKIKAVDNHTHVPNLVGPN